MTKLTLRYFVALFLAGSFSAHAAVKVATLAFVPTTPDYIVPAGKVLLIEHISAFYGNSMGGTFNKVIITIAAQPDNSTGIVTTPWSFATSDPNQSIHLDRPLRAGAGSAVNIFDSVPGAAQDVRIQGLLVDVADLYAANLNPDVDSVALLNQKLTATVNLASARPAIFTSTTSPDLATWVENLTQIVSRQPDPLQYTLSTSIDRTATRDFLRLSARTPEIP